MHTKKLFLIPLLLAPICLCSCVEQKKETGIVTLPYGQLYDSSKRGSALFKKTSYSDLSSFIENKESFFVIVRGTSEDCICWSTIASNLGKYVKHSNLLVHYLALAEFDGKNYFGLDLAKNYQTIAIFENGSLKYQTKFDDESELGSKYDSLAIYLSEHLQVGNVLYVSKSQLDALYEGDKAFVVGFSRSTCSDCSYVSRHHLKELSLSGNYETSYLFDCDVEGVRLFHGATPNHEGNEEAKIAYQNWISFKNEYGLSLEGNEEFGYKEGYVPTWTYNLPKLGKSEAIRDMAIWGNDSIVKKDGKYMISESYYDGNRGNAFLSDEEVLKKANVKKTNLIGLELNENEVISYADGTMFAWNHETSSLYEDPLLTAFFDTYLRKSI